MTFPYRVMRLLAGPAASVAKRGYQLQIQAVEARARRRLDKGVSASVAHDLEALIQGCRAAQVVLDRVPALIERWRLTDDAVDANRSDRAGGS